MQNYLNHASSLLGRDVLSGEGMALLFLATVISAQLVYLVAKSLTQGHAEYRPSLVLCILTLLMVPLAMIGLEMGLAHADVSLRRLWLMFLSLILPGLLVTSFLAARSFRCNACSGALSILPAMIFIFIFINLLNHFDKVLISGGEKAGFIKERTAELDQLLK